jgi:hypothetical protein
MKAGELYLGKFPYGDVPGMKLRPLLLLTSPIGTIPEIVAAYISSITPAGLLNSDLVLDPTQPEFAGTNLKKLCVLRLHKLATLHRSSLVRYLGKLSTSTELLVAAKLRVLFGL